jgi:hypothetical protein
MKTSINAGRYGGELMVKAGLLLFGLAEGWYLMNETNGDFANGILFFLEAHSNIYFPVFFILYVSACYLFGSVAGYQVIIKKKRQLPSALLFGFMHAFIIILCFSGCVLLINHSIDPAYNRKHKADIINYYFRAFLIILVPVVIMWIWAANRMANIVTVNE